MLGLLFDEDKFESMISRVVREEIATPQPLKETTFMQTGNEVGKNLHSMPELANFMGCCLSTAQKMKNEGRIPYRQVGRKVIFNTTEVLKAMEPGLRRKQKSK